MPPGSDLALVGTSAEGVGDASADGVPNGTQVVSRVFDILEAFITVGPRLTVTDVSRHVGLKYATAHRLLEAMAHRGILSRETDSRRYRIGPRLRQLASSGRLEDFDEARPFLQELTDRTGEASHLAIRDDAWAVYIDNVPSPRMLSPHRHVGRRMPLHCTGVGKVLISELSDGDLEALAGRGLTRFTTHTIVDPARLREEVRRVRTLGFAVDNEETEDGLICIAAPVREASGGITGAVSLGGPASRLGSRIAATAKEVIACANEISSCLGWQAA